MKEKKRHKAYPVPMGSWDPASGSWYHNRHLIASRDEQRYHNIWYGYLEEGENNGAESDKTDD